MPDLKHFLFLPFGAAGSSITNRKKKREPMRRRPSSAGEDRRLHRTNINLIHHDTSGRDNVEYRGLSLDLKRETLGLQNMTENEIVRDWNSPIHMWAVTTLFPLMAGTFGPIANMFNICAISVPWRLKVDPDSTQANGVKIPDPPWLIAVNVVSLAIAIVANIALLGQMTNRIRYNISAPVNIAGWYISGIVDIALVAAAAQNLPLPEEDGATYSQAFYYAALSGAIYLILGMMLTMTAYKIYVGGYSDQYKLSDPQRSLMLQTILFLTFVLVSGTVFASVEGWSYLDSTYFTVVTCFTIGFGDFSPETQLGRGLIIPVSIFGILFVGIIISNIRALVVESGNVKVSTRLVEKARRRAIAYGRPEEGVLRVRGIRRRSITADTERERREKEFKIMREIQREASTTNKLFGLWFAVISFSVLWFIGAVVFWKASHATGGEEWTYFESLYFSYIAQLTIGYGDFGPHTNSGKPAFVFWSLIALPTLTVLIGSVGDVVGEFVNWYTVWISSQAHGIWILARLFKAKKKSPSVSDAEVGSDQKSSQDADAATSGEDFCFGDIAIVHRRRLVPRDLNTSVLNEDQLIIAEETYRPFLLLRAAQTVINHLDDSSPRRYTYREWAWLLQLIGEDETDISTHRRVGVRLPSHLTVATPAVMLDHTTAPQTKPVWSWIGQESPLMNLEDWNEPKWVLRRLMESLEAGLRRKADGKVERKTGVDLDGDGEIGTYDRQKVATDDSDQNGGGEKGSVS